MKLIDLIRKVEPNYKIEEIQSNTQSESLVERQKVECEYDSKSTGTQTHRVKYKPSDDKVSDHRLEIIDDILLKAPKNFKSSFVSIMQKVVKTNGYLHPKQYNALVNIYYSWKMDVEKRTNLNKKKYEEDDSIQKVSSYLDGRKNNEIVDWIL